MLFGPVDVQTANIVAKSFIVSVRRFCQVLQYSLDNLGLIPVLFAASTRVCSLPRATNTLLTTFLYPAASWVLAVCMCFCWRVGLAPGGKIKLGIGWMVVERLAWNGQVKDTE
jgi:hypothetical protein